MYGKNSVITINSATLLGFELAPYLDEDEDTVIKNSQMAILMVVDMSSRRSVRQTGELSSRRRVL